MTSVNGVDNGSHPRKHSPKMTQEMADSVRRLRSTGMLQHDIAALLGVNQGRISEVLNGKSFPTRERDLFDNGQ